MFLINQLNCYLDLGHVINVITHFFNVLQWIITMLEKISKISQSILTGNNCIPKLI